jgi:hypothetical protein
MDACGGCPTKCEMRRRHATTGNAATSRQTRGKREERHQWTRGDDARYSGCGTLHRWANGVEELLILEVKSLQRKIFKECCFVL